MKKTLLTITFFIGLTTFGQDKKELASVFEHYLNTNDERQTHKATFSYNNSLNTVTLNSISDFKKENRIVKISYIFSLENIEYIEEEIQRLDELNIYSYTLVLHLKDPIRYNSELIKNNEAEIKTSLDKEIFLSPATNFFLQKSDIDILKKFTNQFFKGIKKEVLNN